MTEAAQYVSAAALERGLAVLDALPGEPRAGFFGPGSAMWQVSRESALFLGAGRAALLQLAHPWVAASLVHHSNLLHDAIGRFHGTFRVIFTMVFGSRAQALAAARGLYALHTGITGELPHRVGSRPAGERYEANEVAALRWVHATLVDSAMLAYGFVLPLSDAQREAYYAEMKRLAMLCGVPDRALLPNWGAFERYFAEMCASDELGVDENARALGASVMSGVGTWVRPPKWYHALTASWMPERFRAGFGLAFGIREQAMVTRASRWVPRVYARLPRASRWVPRVYARLPRAARFVGPYLEAEARLSGREPGWVARRSNRFWMGRERMMYRGSEGG